MIEIMRICKSLLVRMTTYTWLPAEEVWRDTSHLVTASAIQIKQELSSREI